MHGVIRFRCRRARDSKGLAAIMPVIAEPSLNEKRQLVEEEPMQRESRQAHWENVYARKGEREVSWFQESPVASLEQIAAIGAPFDAAIIDIGGGASRLVDKLIERGFLDVTVLDLSRSALDAAKARLGEHSAKACWIVADVTSWEPLQTYDIWHDRAAFHFLTEASDRAAYMARVRRAFAETGSHSG